ncbi:MAG: hypothetical protein U0176_04880 [Bacteroidia bacterium]
MQPFASVTCTQYVPAAVTTIVEVDAPVSRGVEKPGPAFSVAELPWVMVMFCRGSRWATGTAIEVVAMATQPLASETVTA